MVVFVFVLVLIQSILLACYFYFFQIITTRHHRQRNEKTSKILSQLVNVSQNIPISFDMSQRRQSGGFSSSSSHGNRINCMDDEIRYWEQKRLFQ